MSFAFTNTFQASAIDLVKIRSQEISQKKSAHNIEVIQRALEETEQEYGPFIFKEVSMYMTPGRMLHATAEGKEVNISLVPASEEWDTTNVPIRIPVRLGLLNYRLLLINKVDLPKFAAVSTLDELNQYHAGLLRDWVTTKVYKKNGLNVIDTSNFKGLFLMLKKHRFDYMPRAVYEIYDELAAQKSILGDVVVEPTIALHIPMLTYIYVSPKEPRIAKRLEKGLKKLIVSGELKEILYKHYGDDIRRANLKEQNIIHIDNSHYQYKDSQYDQYLLNNE